MKEVQEHLELIATRKPPGDSWEMVSLIPSNVIVGLVPALTAYMRATKHKGSYKLDPLKGELYAITVTTITTTPLEPEKFDLYGEY